MRTEILLGLCLMAVATPLAAQQVRVDRATQVRSVRIVADGGPPTAPIPDRLATRGRGGQTGLRQTFRWLPFVTPVQNRLFDPVELQRDKERVRIYYEQAGYPDAAVEYDIAHDTEENVVDITFRVEPGDPLLVSSVTIEWDPDAPTPGSLGPLAINAPTLAVREGQPLEQAMMAPTMASIAGWLADRGYPSATVEPVVAVDSASRTAAVTFRTLAGPRTRIGAIDVEGNTIVETDAIRRLLEVRTGDWFSASTLQLSGQRIAGLDVVSRATFERRPTVDDSVIDLLLRVRELPPRQVLGEVGYTTDGGISGHATWTHRNIFGGAQTLTADVAGQSGVLAISENPDKFVRTGISIRLPIRGRANLTLNVGPYVELRDDFRDRSLEVGLESTLLYQFAPLSSIALRHVAATRRIREYRFGDIASGLDFIELLRLDSEGVLDTLGARIGTHTVSLSAVVGSLDVPTDPVRGFVIEPTLAATVPGDLSSTEHLTGTFRASGYVPVTPSFSLAARMGAGRLWPRGRSVPASPDGGLREFLRLRDAVFTAGGAGDVRGWAGRLLGPKLPRFLISSADDSTATITADRYVPLGGFNLVHGTLELRFRMPGLGERWGAHTFVDAGRVWTHDARFTDPADPNGIEKLFWSTGLGFDYVTAVGALRFSVGYKLNPSVLDLAEPGETADAIIRGLPLSTLPRHDWRRVQLHVGFGRRL